MTVNPMVPTIARKNFGEKESLYTGIAKSQLAILRRQLELGGLKIGERKVRLDDGTEVLCNICYNYEAVQIFVPPSLPSNKLMRNIADYGLQFRCLKVTPVWRYLDYTYPVSDEWTVEYAQINGEYTGEIDEDNVFIRFYDNKILNNGAKEYFTEISPRSDFYYPQYWSNGKDTYLEYSAAFRYKVLPMYKSAYAYYTVASAYESLLDYRFNFLSTYIVVIYNGEAVTYNTPDDVFSTFMFEFDGSRYVGYYTVVFDELLLYSRESIQAKFKYKKLGVNPVGINDWHEITPIGEELLPYWACYYFTNTGLVAYGIDNEAVYQTGEYPNVRTYTNIVEVNLHCEIIDENLVVTYSFTKDSSHNVAQDSYLDVDGGNLYTFNTFNYATFEETFPGYTKLWEEIYGYKYKNFQLVNTWLLAKDIAKPELYPGTAGDYYTESISYLINACDIRTKTCFFGVRKTHWKEHEILSYEINPNTGLSTPVTRVVSETTDSVSLFYDSAPAAEELRVVSSSEIFSENTKYDMFKQFGYWKHMGYDLESFVYVPSIKSGEASFIFYSKQYDDGHGRVLNYCSAGNYVFTNDDWHDVLPKLDKNRFNRCLGMTTTKEV